MDSIDVIEFDRESVLRPAGHRPVSAVVRPLAKSHTVFPVKRDESPKVDVREWPETHTAFPVNPSGIVTGILSMRLLL